LQKQHGGSLANVFERDIIPLGGAMEFPVTVSPFPAEAKAAE
jgi:hypothetical protein